jgi:uncharacterized membrane protein YphA (DoxX/SURF4 family)
MLSVNIVLWVLQIILAVAFFLAGSFKISQPKDKLRPKMSWVDSYSAGGVKLIALAEILGALGLILPWATGIAKILTPLAALGLLIIMIGAVATHVRRKEPWIPQLIIAILCLIVAIWRF